MTREDIEDVKTFIENHQKTSFDNIGRLDLLSVIFDLMNR